MTDQTVDTTAAEPVQTPDAAAPEAKAEAKPEDTTLLTDPGEGKPGAADWPDDWRQKLAGDDEKAAKAIARFKSPQDLWKSFSDAQAKIRSGEVKATLPKDATEEQIAEYRKSNGIPDKAEGYLENLPNGLVIGDEDKELALSYLERVHGKNASPEIAHEALNWYYEVQEQQIAERSEQDKAYRTEAEDELRAEWGNEYRVNINSIKAFLDSAPEGLSDLLSGARLSDGTPLAVNPQAMRWLLGMANEANPAGFVAPSNGASQIDSVNSEIANIEKMMREDRKSYDKNPEIQKRYLALLEAQDKLSSRAA